MTSEQLEKSLSSTYAEPQNTSSYKADASFVSCLNPRLEESKFGTTISSTTSSY